MQWYTEYKNINFYDGVWVRVWVKGTYVYESHLPIGSGYEVNHTLGLIYHTYSYEMKCDRLVGNRIRLRCLALQKYSSKGIWIPVRLI